MAMMEGLTHYIMDKHSPSSRHNKFLKTRAWEGNSHIGNRPKQATFYYDWVRSLKATMGDVSHVCEIGMNGGHSALIFLAALSAWYDGGDTENDAASSSINSPKVTMFDLAQFDYSPSAKEYIEILYPRRFTLHKGNSQEVLPKWTAEHQTDKCHVFSIDGDHSYKGARVDILNAVKATRKGGLLILDDMNPGGPTRRAFESVLKDEPGLLVNKQCVENVDLKVGYDDRYDETNARDMVMSWCTATVA